MGRNTLEKDWDNKPGLVSRAALLAVLMVVAIFSILPSSAEPRAWENKDGGKLEGELLAVAKNVAVIQRTGDCRIFRIPLTSLSLQDQQLIGKLLKGSKIGPELKVPLPEGFKSSLKSHYAFDASDKLGVDSTGNGSTLGSNETKMSWAEPGLVNGAASFNGRNSVFWMRKFMSLKNQPMTISCWVKTEYTGEQEIISYGGPTQGFALYTNNRTTGYVYRWGSRKDAHVDIRFSKAAVSDGRWHHVCAVTSEDGSCVLWVDGERSGLRNGTLIREEPNYGGTLGSIRDIRSNVRKTRDSKPFDGLIDEFMIFDRAFADLEVSELYDSHRAFAND